MLQPTFIISRQPALLEQPSKGPLDQPTFGQDFESADLVAASYDVQMQLAAGAQSFDPRHQRADAGAVGPDFGQPLIPADNPRQQRLGPVAILFAGRTDVNPQPRPKRVHQDVPLTPLDLFARVVAARTALVAQFDTLAVEHGGRRLSIGRASGGGR